MSRLIDLELKTGTVWLSCPWDVQIVGTIKTIPGREFHKSSRRWSVPIEQIALVIERLGPLHFKFTPRMRDWWKANRDALPSPTATEDLIEVDPADGYSVSRLNEAARAALTNAFGGEVWVVAELDGFDRNKSGHAYFELIERTVAGGPPIARIRAVMFASTRARLERELPEGVEFGDGVRLRVRGKVELYLPSGSYQLVVEGLDVEWTLGARRRKRDEILGRLEALGIAEANRCRTLPLLPLRVGLITAAESDAHADFIDELERSGFAFSVLVHDARMQGRDTEDSVVAALAWFAGRSDAVDVVVVTRGGGSRGDLGYFDSMAIGEAVCRHPVKVVAGIGHHRDRCVLDFVAHSEKTPTAAAQLLVARAADALRRVSDGQARIGAAAQAALRDAERSVDTAARRCERSTRTRLQSAHDRYLEAAHGVERCVAATLGRASRRVDVAAVRLAERSVAPTDGARRRTDDLWSRLGRASAQLMSSQKTAVDYAEAKLRLADPRRLVERGFVIVRDDVGRVVLDAAQLVALKRVTLQMRDGAVHAQPMEMADE